MSLSGRAVRKCVCPRAGLSRLPVRERRPLPRATTSLFRRATHSRATETPHSPSSKICAVPFGVTPEAATERLYDAGLVATAQLGNVLLGGLHPFLGRWISGPARSLGLGEGLTLNEMRAVYYPIWRCDAVFEGELANETLFNEKRLKRTRAWLGVENGYVPGNPFEPLSYLSFAVPELPDHLRQYDPATDLQQLGDGYDIVPIPFTVTPFDLIKKIREDAGDFRIWEGLAVMQDRWIEKMLVCYPVMFPLYIADFSYQESEDQTTRFQLIMDAQHTKLRSCRVSVPTPDMLVELGRARKYYCNPVPFLPPRQVSFHSAMIKPSTVPTRSAEPIPMRTRWPPDGNVISNAFDDYMSPAPQPDTMEPSPLVDAHRRFAHPDGIDWTDPRIQSWSDATHLENVQYLREVLHYGEGMCAMQTMDSGAPAKGFAFEIDNTTGKRRLRRQDKDQVKQLIGAEMAAHQRALDERAPAWLRQYNESQSQSRARAQAQEALTAEIGGETPRATQGKAPSRSPGQSRPR